MEGEQELFGNFDKALANIQQRLANAMESVLMDIVNFVKANGPWHDRTGNLRNSISHSAPELLPGGGVRGVVYAGMEYAIYVEYCDGYWVLSGAMEEFRPRILNLIKERMAA